MKQKTLLLLCALLALETMIFPVIMQANDNSIKKNDQWWKEFIQAQPAVQEPGYTHNNNVLAKDDQWWQKFINAQQEPQESWYDKLKKRIDQLRQVYKPGTVIAIVAGSFTSGFLLRSYLLKIKFFLSDRNKLLALDRQKRNLKEAITASDVPAVKNILGDLYNDEIHCQLAANNSKSEDNVVGWCPVCMEVIPDPKQYQIGSKECFHFICTTCKNSNAQSGRSNGHNCPICRSSAF